MNVLQGVSEGCVTRCVRGMCYKVCHRGVLQCVSEGGVR